MTSVRSGLARAWRRLNLRYLYALAGLLALLFPVLAAGASGEGIELVPETAVLLNQSAISTSGNGGNTSSTSTMTNIFSPPTFVDYKRIGTEPVVRVDKYPYPVPTSGDLSKLCPGGVEGTRCYKDIVYVDSTEGFGYPGYDFFWKSENLGQTFRLPHNEPTVGGRAIAQGRGGGDGDHDVGTTGYHRVYFIDLAFDHVTMNTSDDHGDTFVADDAASAPDTPDDRQWVAADEPNVYMNYNAQTDPFAGTIILKRSKSMASPGSFQTDSLCSSAEALLENPAPAVTGPIGDNVPTKCPDPQDPQLSVAGPIVVDKSPGPASATSHPHRLYIPFLRCSALDDFHGFLDCGPPFQLYIAYSDDGGDNWLRQPLCNTTTHTGPCLTPTQNPRNIFVEMTIDRGGNLYYTWAQRPVVLDADGNDVGGETDIYYSYSTNGGITWSPGINLTKETGDSAVWPWMVAGDPGQVDLVYYKANCGANPSTADGCVWNVYFGQSQNALNTGPNFKSVQISDHPNHIGAICQSGLGCSSGRTLGDFFTMDVDHRGAANVVWADDNNAFNGTNIKFSRQLSGNSVYKNTSINLTSTWPIRDHTAYDPQTPDVVTPTSSNGVSPSCSSMDIKQVSSSRSGDLLTVNLTLAAPPSGANATTCAAGGEIPAVADGGFWGVAWWSSDDPNDTFYLAYMDQPTAPTHVEAGRFDSVSVPSLIANEPQFVENGMLGGNCMSALPPTPCTLTMSASLGGLGIKSGAGLYSLTGLSLYITGDTSDAPAGYTSLGDATPAIDYNGTGTTTK